MGRGEVGTRGGRTEGEVGWEGERIQRGAQILGGRGIWRHGIADGDSFAYLYKY
jgi:hypothetical protein